jgi:CHAT domain-containing protein
LWELPFQALQSKENRYLIEDHAISYAPSLTVLREMRKRRQGLMASPASSSLLAFGNPALRQETIKRTQAVYRDERLEPLPEAEREVKALAQLYGAQRSKIYTGSGAREKEMKANASNYRILHLATHGILDDASPMYSHLLLSQLEGDADEDGLLEAWELMQLDLRAEMVVLSACETARGRIGAGEGMIGLSWALFVAGSPTIVVSQWKVESASTTELMLEFHRNLEAGGRDRKLRASKADALRQAALKLMATPQSRHPFYWAGFVVIGDGG